VMGQNSKSEIRNPKDLRPSAHLIWILGSLLADSCHRPFTPFDFLISNFEF